MTLFAEFVVPADEFAFHRTFQQLPALEIQIERVVATSQLLTPYFWVANVPADDFENAAEADPSIGPMRLLDEFDEAAHYRAEWTDGTEALVYAYTNVGATIVEARGTGDEWELRMRFDDRGQLDDFNTYLADSDVPYDLRRLYEISHPRTGSQFGLTRKQYETLTTAWELGYFDLPRTATMEAVAAELGISPQSFSDRLRRAQETLIEEALRVDTAAEPDGSRSDS